jgi:hypothetical protein
VSPRSPWLRACWSELGAVARTMGIAAVAGFVAGTIVAGTLLRLAM